MAARGGVGDEVLDDARMLGMQAGDVVVDGVERDDRRRRWATFKLVWGMPRYPQLQPSCAD